MTYHRVLDRKTDRDALARWISNAGFELGYASDRSDTQRYTRSWVDSADTQLDYVEHHRLGVRTITVTGPGSADMASKLEAEFSIVSQQQILEALKAQTDLAERVRYVSALAKSTTEEFDASIQAWFASELDRETDLYRDAVAFMASHIDWEEMEELLAEQGYERLIN